MLSRLINVLVIDRKSAVKSGIISNRLMKEGKMKMNKQELIQKLEDIEWEDFEVKEAKSEVPKNSWETVSAFLNTAHYSWGF